MICEFCGEAKPDVDVRIDPFDYDVNNKTTRVAACVACIKERAEEI